MNDGLIKVEICIVNGDWQWTGKLSTESLKQLCKLADKLNDADYFTNVLTNLAMQEEYGKTHHSGGWEELHIPTLKHGIELATTEAYKKGHADGAIEVINNTCDICGSYPMTTNCNNAGCDA